MERNEGNAQGKKVDRAGTIDGRAQDDGSEVTDQARRGNRPQAMAEKEKGSSAVQV